MGPHRQKNWLMLVSHPSSGNGATDVRLISKIFVGDVVLGANQDTGGSVAAAYKERASDLFKS